MNPRRLGVPSGVSKMIFEAMVRSAQTVAYLGSKLVLSPNRLKRVSTWASSPRSTIGCVQNNFWACGIFGANRAPILYQDSHYLLTDRNELLVEPRHIGVPSSASKMIFEPMVHLAQFVHLSCTDTNTISKGTKTRFQMTHVTLEFHRVRQKLFSRLWYVRRKLCTYLVSRLSLSSNKPKWASTWVSSPMYTIGCDQTISKPMVHLVQIVHLSCTNTDTVSKRTETRL
jgi:hypothetical protein